jgi:hypothetical protein
MPIKTVGNFGVFEGVWVMILTLIGWDERGALATAVAAHVGILATLAAAVSVVLITAASVLGVRRLARSGR